MAQSLSNLRTQNIFVDSDTISLDSLSIIPQSELIQVGNGVWASQSDYQIDYGNALLIAPGFKGKSIKIKYRVFPLLFTKTYAHKNSKLIEQEDPGKYDYFTLKPQNQSQELFSISGLNKNGSISRGVSFGNNQDLSVSSNLDLQLSGKVTDDINIQAAISDNNLPIQPEGNTQQLQEFDRVFIRLFNDDFSLIAGDFLITRPDGYFMNLNKKVQGGGFSTRLQTHKSLDKADQGTFETSINAAISRGKFARNVIPGIEGNQGPYQLKGDEGETFIIVLSGTERVYVNGRLMKRGQDNDYIIDYNTAELTFTPQQIITKDQRIVVEFQYSERNYARSLYFVENSYSKNKLKVNFNIYSEQDNKNQPLVQELNSEEKRLLGEVGDNLDQAIISGVDSSDFVDDQVRYKKIDTLGFRDVLVYSKNPDSAIFSAKFSLVGAGKGNYIQVRSDANGRVFQWVQPIAGIPQGTHEPIIVLITPKQRQMFTLGADYAFDKNNLLKIESAYTKNDINTFSTKDAKDDRSYAMMLDYKGKNAIRKRDNKADLLWTNKVFYEQRGRNFQYIERYRAVEFERNWNIQGLVLEGNEYLTELSTGIGTKTSNFNYEFGSFTKGHDYEGIRNGYNTRLAKKGFSLQSKGSLLQVNAKDNSSFLRHYSTISQEVFGLKIGGYLEQEKILFYKGKSDTLQANSFDRIIWRSFIEKGDSTTANSYRLSYSEIYDYFPRNEALNYALKSENFGLDFKMASNPNSRLNGKVTYRKLLIQNDELASRNPENTLLGRIDYAAKAWKGLLSSNTFYQLGSGLENQREFSFLKVNDGQGTHLWIDFNGNGVTELNEFEVAGPNNAFQASYIKVFTPSNNYIRVFSNQFNQVIFLRPSALINAKQGFKKWLGKFSNKASYRAERKTQKESAIYNPFNTSTDKLALITINSSISNTVFFNRLNTKFGMDYFYLNTQGKSLLINGFESRGNEVHEIKTRYNINQLFGIETRATESSKRNRSEFFSNRNYTILSREAEPTFIYQPTVRLRLSVSAIYAERVNTIGTEKSINQTLSSEFRYNQAGKGAFLLELNYIQIEFNSSNNSSLAFEMLDGLQTGNNITWNLNWQRNLSNSLQLNLSYGGRNSENIPTIHTGSMQIRAFF